jgi:hypothetical protein
MTIPTAAKKHVTQHLESLGKLEVGQAVYFCMVRPGGEKDPNVRVAFGDSESTTTVDVFARVWKQDADVKPSERPDWIVARGVLVAGKDGLRVLPGVRANRVTAKAELKDTFKALRTYLKDEGVPAAPLQQVISGEFGTTSQYTTWARTSGAAADGALDEAETEAVKDTKSTRVLKLVAEFKKVGLKAALEAHASAKEEGARAVAREKLEAVAVALEKLVEGSVDARRTLVGRVLGKSRYKDSLLTLDDLDARLRVAQNEVQKALGRTFEGADLTGRSDSATSDPILKTLRALLEKLRSAPDGAKVGVLAELYFAADYWLKAAGVGQARRDYSDGVDKEMKAQVEEFYTKAANRLAKEAKVGINALPGWLEKHYGKGMEAHGTDLDVARGLAKWMTADQRDLFRVHIKGGKLYQYDWWTWGPDTYGLGIEEMTLVPADSSKYPSDAITAGFSGFVLSMGGDLYMTQQYPVAQNDGDQRSVFHSSYMAGLPVRMAGELKVTAGKVQVVNARSGHYRPPVAMVVKFVQHMQMLGVKVEQVMPKPREDDLMRVEDFLKQYGNEEPSPDDFEQNDRAMSALRQQIQFDSMLKADEKAYDDARMAIVSLETAVARARSVRVAVAKGTATLIEANQENRLKVAARNAVPDAEKAVDVLTPRVEALKLKLEERRKNHAELVKKDATPVAEVADGYVTALTDMVAKSERLIARYTAASTEARNPSPVPLTEPSAPSSSESDQPLAARQIEALRDHVAFHDGLAQAAAERLLRERDAKAWLLRSSLSTGNKVVVSFSSTRGGKTTFTHQVVGTEISYDDLDKRLLSRPAFMVRA